VQILAALRGRDCSASPPDVMIFETFAWFPMSIYEDVLRFIEQPEASHFEALALAVFRYQFERILPYRDYCRSLGVDPGSVGSLDEVPAVSTLAFKYAALENHDLSGQGLVFFTSGTTIGRDERGRHVVPRPEVYRASALAHLGRMLFPDRMRLRMLALHPDATRAPESSLARMITWCVEEFGLGPGVCAADRLGLDLEMAMGVLAQSERERAPLCILGTTASLGALFARIDESGKRFRLAAGSRVMDTGGAKGQAVPMEPAEVIRGCVERLGVGPAMVINEYGMTELCSQLYDATPFNSADAGEPGRRAKIAPAWLRCAAVDPVTLRPVGEGRYGLLRFFDLANVGSVSCVLTEDVGRVENGRVYLAGRAAMADIRGCALGIEQFQAYRCAVAGGELG
jgi:hypothetical protein